MTPRKKILIVDDEDSIRAIGRITLESKGYEVFQAADGREGIEILAQHRPDLIILDLMMPEMNGIEFCNRMIGRLKMKDVPVMVLSAVNEEAGVVKQFLELPIERKEFVAKPIDSRELAARVLALIGGPGDEAEARAKAAATPPKPPPAPRAADPRPSPPPRRPATKTAGGLKIRVMVIDDDEDIRILLRTALGLHFEVETAENGMDALTMIDRVDPDFIISDINMPGMNGLETVEAIRRHPRYGSVPVFFLTGETDKDLPRKSFDVGGNLYLRKPIDPARLLKLIDHFIAETGLRPRPRAAGRPASVIKTIERSSGKAPAGKVRVLSVNYDAQQTSQLKEWLGGRDDLEVIWADDARSALGNLSRWEPDVVLFNPRNPGLDGIAFGQSLRMRKLAGRYQIAFVGETFFPADLDYSLKSFGRPVIDLGGIPAEHSHRELDSVLGAGREKLKPKRQTIQQLLAEDEEHRSGLRAARNKLDKQREFFRDRFGKIQDFIDSQHAL